MHLEQRLLILFFCKRILACYLTESYEIQVFVMNWSAYGYICCNGTGSFYLIVEPLDVIKNCFITLWTIDTNKVGFLEKIGVDFQIFWF